MENQEEEVLGESASPLPVEKTEDEPRRVPIQITFGRALDMVLDGHKLTRRAWDDANVYIYMSEGKLCLYQNTVHTLIVSEGDMRGEDWVIVE